MMPSDASQMLLRMAAIAAIGCETNVPLTMLAGGNSLVNSDGGGRPAADTGGADGGAFGTGSEAGQHTKLAMRATRALGALRARGLHAASAARNG